MRQCEFKRRYDPDLGRYVKKHIYTGEIYGEGMSDVFKSVGSKILRKANQKSATKKAATKTGEYEVKGGYKIVELLRKNKTKTPSVMMEPSTSPSEPELTTEEINDRVNQILSGGKLRRRRKMKFYLNI